MTGFGTFPLGLSDEQEQRAARLHREAVVIDLLYWGPASHQAYTAEMEQELRDSYADHRSTETSIMEALHQPHRRAAAGRMPELHDIWAQSGVTAGSLQLAVGDPASLLASAAYLTAMTDSLDWMRKVNTADDIVQAKAQGQLAWIGNCQPIVPVSRDLALLDHARDLGLRMLMLTYNQQDHVGAGGTEIHDAGLSAFGRRVVEHCNANRIVVDTAHCGPQTTLDACRTSQAPVVASHTSSKAVFGHDRGKSDDVLKALASTGGVIGIVTVPFFIAEPRKADLHTWANHVEHVAELVGVEHVAIGTDWPMPGPIWSLELVADFAAQNGFRGEEHQIDDTAYTTVGFDDYRDFVNLTRVLVARGWSDEDVTAVLGGNALRVLREVLG
jgi:membrane dipeptidase